MNAPSVRRRRLGARGEQAAAEWYAGEGYQVVARNWRCRAGEIDLVCRRGGILVVCEVKTRSSELFGSAVEAVTPVKQRRLRQLATRWLEEHPIGCREIRFDVAAVRAGRVDVIEGPFDADRGQARQVLPSRDAGPPGAGDRAAPAVG